MRHLPRLLIIACLLGTACGNTNESVREFTIVYSGNIGGKIEPCGCHPPLGGFPRRATLVNALRNQYTDPLILDSGALMFDTNFLTKPLDYLQRLDAGVSAAAMAEIGTHAINVSSFDLANSVDSLIAIDRSMDLPWLSANLTWREDGELVFESDASYESNGVQVGVFGVMSDSFRGSPLFDDDSPLEVTDYRKAAAREVQELESSNDVVVALAYLSKREVETLANEVDGIDVIIHSQNGFQTPSSDHGLFEPYMINDTLILRCPDGGRVLGIAEITLVGNSTTLTKRDMPIVPESDEQHLDMIRKQGSTYQNTFVDLGAEIRSDPEIQQLVENVTPVKEAYKTEMYSRRN